MTAASTLLIERAGPIVKLILNRPEQGNALNRGLGDALLDQAIRCDNDPTIRCVVITGTGKMFCAGGDIGAFTAAGDDISTLISEGTYLLHTALAKLARMAKPLVVLVNGPAAGAGLGLALAGDIVIAASSAHFTAGYTAIGMTPDAGLTWLLPKLVGLRRAQEMILTNRRVFADEAVSMGLITRTSQDDALIEDGLKTAQLLADGPAGAFAAARALIRDGFANGLESQLELEARAITRAATGAEARKAFAAFFDRR